MTDNLALWQQVEKTPVAHVKEITGKSYKGNSPKPHYLIHKATETFGPCGIGWGFIIVDERVDEGAGGERLHVARVKVWYEWQGKRGEVEHIGGTQFSGLRSSGKPFTDEDAPKKSVTDALVKALSMIGFAGDIFMGRYDDSKYVSELRQEAAEEKHAADKQPKSISAAEQKRQLTEIDNDLLDAHTDADVKRVADIWQAIATRDGWSRDYKLAAKDKFDAKREELRKRDVIDDIQDTFPGSRVVNETPNLLAAGE